MCKSEIFAETINLVAQGTEIPASRILSSDKDTETVDARYLLVQLLVERGMYPSLINFICCVLPIESMTS